MAGQHIDNKAALIGSAFALGVAAGFLLKGAAKGLFKRARRKQWHREYQKTIAYGQNLPKQLERREPAPQPGQPRFGGTGALGVPPERVL